MVEYASQLAWSFVLAAVKTSERFFDFVQNTEQVKWKKYWNPRLYMDNCVGDPKETIWYSVLFNSRHEAYVVERRRVKGTFVQTLQLTQFPFDTQVYPTRKAYFDALAGDPTTR